MFKNYFKTAIRHLFKHKVFTFINIVGLAIGISAAMVIYLVVHFDFSFDKQHADAHRIFRIVSDYSYQGETSHNSGVPIPLFKAIVGVSGVEQAAPFINYSGGLTITVPAPNTAAAVFKNQEQVMMCDERYFKIFDYYWIAGSANALNEPNHVVLTQSRAKMYFPDLQPAQVLNKIVIYDDSLKLAVAGVVADVTQNTDFNFHDFISASTVANRLSRPFGGDLDGGFNPASWTSTSSYFQLFVKLNTHTKPDQVIRQLNVLLKQNSQSNPPGETHTLNLQPLKNLHFDALYDAFDQRQANRPVLYSLLGVAVFLLALGCINFINLTTAQSAQRSREVGVRKTIGGTRQQLVGQFLMETFLLTGVAALLSTGLAYFLIKAFANFIPPGVKYEQLFAPPVLAFIAVLVVLVSVISGLYPAAVMSAYRPVQVLKGPVGNSGLANKASFSLRKVLTITQFIIAQFFIMATLLVSSQIHYLLNKDLGFKKDAVLYMHTPLQSANPNAKQVLYEKLKLIPQIEVMSFGGDAPSSRNVHSTEFVYNDGKTERKADVQFKYGDQNFVTVYQLKLLAGRNLQAHDSIGGFIINDTYRKFLGFKTPAEAVGKTVMVNDKAVSLIGVMSDFYQASLRDIIKPVALCYSNNPNYSKTLHIALKPEAGGNGSWKIALTKMETAWQQTYPNTDFEYRFVDESIARFYTSEQNTAQLLRWATGLSVLISCLGLLGLAIYTASQRTKEIGIRKVMGATVMQLVSMLSIDFVKLIVIAFVIAAPVALYAMQRWLQNFAYHTAISVWLFVGTVLLTVGVALLTMSFQTVKAALSNPVKSLRSE